jgi:hypothetical protein
MRYQQEELTRRQQRPNLLRLVCERRSEKINRLRQSEKLSHFGVKVSPLSLHNIARQINGGNDADQRGN